MPLSYSNDMNFLCLKKIRNYSDGTLQKDGEHFSSHEVLIRRVQEAFKRFVESTEQSCRQR